jgi:phosphoglycerate dehydrogenase-like enzyme
MLKVLIDLPRDDRSEQLLKQIAGISVHWVQEPAEKIRPLPEQQIADCDILCCTFPPENHIRMTQLKMIQISSAGYKQLTGQQLAERGIRCCNALGVFDIPIAEWNIAMMIDLARDLRSMIRNQEQGVWDRSRRFQHEIRGSVVGIWGYGGIGRETARLAKALGMRVHVLTRSGIRARDNTYLVPGTGDPEGVLPDRVFVMEEKRAFFGGLDFLVMAIPQTAETEGIVGEAELNMLKSSAFLLNPARGPLVQEAALLRALKGNRIAGAALDTHYQYPLPPDHPLWGTPNVILTPHISGSSSSPHYLERVYDIFIQNIRRWQDGTPLLNELSPRQLEEG